MLAQISWNQASIAVNIATFRSVQIAHVYGKPSEKLCNHKGLDHDVYDDVYDRRPI